LYINYTIVIKPAGQPNNPLIKNLTNQYVNLMTYWRGIYFILN
jgi:hypothetical protein